MAKEALTLARLRKDLEDSGRDGRLLNRVILQFGGHIEVDTITASLIKEGNLNKGDVFRLLTRGHGKGDGSNLSKREGEKKRRTMTKRINPPHC